MADEHKPHVIIAGDIINGYTFYGPYDTYREASAACDHPDIDRQTWVIAPLVHPADA